MKTPRPYCTSHGFHDGPCPYCKPPFAASPCSRLADLVRNLRGLPGIIIGDQWKSRAIADDIEAVIAERDAFRAALKQIVHNPVRQDPEAGFMSGHIAAAVLHQYPENAEPSYRDNEKE